MSLTVSINQPAYLPWMGYWDRIRRSDVHIVLDHVTLEKGGFTNRTQIRQKDGRVMWLTVPVEKGRPIYETQIAGDAWRRKHREALLQAYGWMPDYLDSEWRNLYDLLDWANDECNPGVNVYTVRSSALAVEGRKSELVLNLCEKVGATTYLSGPHGRDYLDLPSFERAGIEVAWHDYPVVQPVLSAVHDLFGAPYGTQVTS